MVTNQELTIPVGDESRTEQKSPSSEEHFMVTDRELESRTN